MAPRRRPTPRSLMTRPLRRSWRVRARKVRRVRRVRTTRKRTRRTRRMRRMRRTTT